MVPGAGDVLLSCCHQCRMWCCGRGCCKLLLWALLDAESVVAELGNPSVHVDQDCGVGLRNF